MILLIKLVKNLWIWLEKNIIKKKKEQVEEEEDKSDKQYKEICDDEDNVDLKLQGE